MSTTYNTIEGDTFEKVARKKYGNESGVNRIQQSNPHASEPLEVGTVLIIPNNPSAPPNKTTDISSVSGDETAIKVGRRVRFWESYSLRLKFDGIAEFRFSAPFVTDFTPFAYDDCEVTVGGRTVFTGTVVIVDPVIESDRKSLSVAGYSLPGVLVDCTVSAKQYPVEFFKQDLATIARTLCDPFGIGVVFETLAPTAFDKVAIPATMKIFDFLADLARQKGLVLSTDERGRLVFRQSDRFALPVAVLSQGDEPLLSVVPQFSPQQYYSSVTGVTTVKIGKPGESYTVNNSRLKGVSRPFTYQVTDLDAGDLRQTVEAKAGRMFANAVSYTAEVNTWDDPTGVRWAPGSFIKLSAPDALILSSYTFLIRSVTFSASPNRRTAMLDLVIPGAFSGEIPGSMPWD